MRSLAQVGATVLELVCRVPATPVSVRWLGRQQPCSAQLPWYSNNTPFSHIISRAAVSPGVL